LTFLQRLRLTADAAGPGDRADGELRRNTWQDTAKGLGIILVVLGHTERGLIEAGILSRAAWHAFDFAIYTFHMPLFMFLAGLNVPRSLKAGTGPFLRSKLLMVIWPYVVWSVIYGIGMAVFSRFANHPTNLSDVLTIGWHPISAYWFLYVLFIFMVVAALVKPYPMLAIAAVTFVLGQPFEQDYLTNQLLHFPLFFTAGIVLRHRGRLPSISTASAVVLAVIWGGSVVVALRIGMTNYSSIVMLPAAMCGIGLVIWLAQKIDRAAWLAYLGRLTMVVYVMHILAGAVVRTLLHGVFHAPLPGLVAMTLCTLGAICGPLIAYAVLDRLHSLPWFGLSIGPRGRRWIGRSKAHDAPIAAAV
jgi:fucose 4-O-acetylase-like acetyltransferase